MLDIGITSSVREGKLSAIEVFTYTGVANEIATELPDRFKLLGNYPNPFNPSTRIVFELPEPGEVSVEVFDVMGRKVLDVPAQTHAAGTRQVLVEASDLASGIYLYRVIARMNTQTAIQAGRMTFIK
jgi:hypothetical protein